MEFIEKTDNVERVYSVYYDAERLKRLLDEIVKKTSYRSYGTFTAPHGAIPNLVDNIFISGATLPNGDPMYKYIRKIYTCTSHGPYRYHNVCIVADATMLTSPELAYIIERILSDEPNSIYEFLNYATHDELVPIDEKIAAANKAVDEISDFEVDKKINALNNLKQFCENKKSNQHFDVELLKKYYQQAKVLIKLQLISEKTMKNSSRVLLKPSN